MSDEPQTAPAKRKAKTTAKTQPSTTARAQPAMKGAAAHARDGSGDYVVPVVHTRVPTTVVNVGFWSGLVGAVALGIIDPALGVLVGAGVVVAQHGRGRGPS